METLTALENKGYGSIVFDSENGLISNSANRTDLQGQIVINGYAYKDSFDTLKDYFGSKLDISCLGYYIRFKDNVVLQLLLDNNYGDGKGITYEKAQTITSISNIFSNNTDITSFDELKEFKNVTTCPRFYGCTSLTSIDCSNITVFNHECLRECNNLTTLKNLGKFTLTGGGQFAGCNYLQLDKDVFKDFTNIPGNLCINNYVLLYTTSDFSKHFLEIQALSLGRFLSSNRWHDSYTNAIFSKAAYSGISTCFFQTNILL